MMRNPKKCIKNLLRYFFLFFLSKFFSIIILATMATKKLINNIPFFYCDICDYKCCVKQRFQIHCQSKKHISNISNKKNNVQNSETPSPDVPNLKCFNTKIITSNFLHDNNISKNGNINNNYNYNKLFCYCGKIYESRSGLWRHKRHCKIVNNVSDIHFDTDNEDKCTSSEFMKFIMNNTNEWQTIIKEIVKNGINNTTNNTNTNNSNNTNNINNTFNLQIYLNETCKNAMNLSEFIDTIKPTLEELELTGREGYVKGISRIVTTRLNDVKTEDKPIQCSDGKREVLYIKENDIWNKEDKEKPLMTNAIKKVAHKNLCNISEWQKLHPDCTEPESRKNDLYLKIVSNSMSGGSKEESDNNHEKIISNVAKKTIIDKTFFLDN